MTLPAGVLRTPSGAVLEVGEVLGRGGEARVHALCGDNRYAVKLYAKPDAERARKLAAMIARAPSDPDRKADHVSIAWPRELVLDASGRAVGFVMPRIDARRYLPLHQLYHPRSRRRRAPGISWRYLVRIAHNLCGALAALHDSDYVVGDLNESNILVDDRALVTLVDLDSIQVTSGFRTFRCNVGKGEYTPPELQGRSFRETNRKPSSDRFGLAVLVFLLLMEGNHPFAGIYHGQGEPPGLEENIRARRTPYFGSYFGGSHIGAPHFGRGPFAPPLAAPPIEMLGPELFALLKRALLGQAWRRPDARALKEALADLESDMVQCEIASTHAHAGFLEECPWCRRAALLGNDPYPGAGRPSSGDRPDPLRSTTARSSASGIDRLRDRPRPGAAAVLTAPGTRPPGRVSAAPPPGSAVAARPAAPQQLTTRTRQVAQTPHPSRPRSGFRGSWPQFCSSLPLLSLSLLTLLAFPAYLWQVEIRVLLSPLTANVATQYALLAALALLPATALSTGLYRRARGNPEFARGLFVLERVARAAIAAGLLSLLASLAAGLFLGRGSVLAGDWLLLPSFWVVAFAVSLRFVGPRRP